ncbi:MAG: J domain-containing protein [Leptospiraceae bacterium]
METLYKYCRLLGVRPGDSAEAVKRAFREKIKGCHPDRKGNEDQARLLIEAYDALKTGVPVMETTPTGARVYRKPATGGRPAAYARSGHTQSDQRGFTPGYRVGQELFRAASGGGEAAGLGAVLRRSATSSEDVPGMEFFRRAEGQLEQTIRRFEGQKHRSKRYWARDYISGIVKVQILYRDVISRYPMLAARARERMHSLERLVLELRTLAR